jgi:tetratricopeptide (TPR) repeat protein
MPHMKRRSIFIFALLLTSLSPAALPQAAQPQEKLLISYPGKTWAVEIDSPGFVVERNERQPDGRQYFLANDPATGLVFSAALEKGNGPADSKTCPDYLRNRVKSLPAGLIATEIRSSQIADFAVIEYLIPTAQKLPVRQKNFVACLTNDDVFVDLHLSKVQFHDSDESLFTDFLKKVRIADISPGASTASSPDAASAAPPSGENTMNYLREGSRYYLASDFRRAIGPYQTALDLEKKNPQLDRTTWRVLVDNLGMAYGITGDLPHAEVTFNYGLSKDPDYPMFYYNLACVNAERNDMDKTIDYLKKAFALKANAIAGEGMPDPRQDDSFQRLMSDDHFRKFVDSLYSSN